MSTHTKTKYEIDVERRAAALGISVTKLLLADLELTKQELGIPADVAGADDDTDRIELPNVDTLVVDVV